MAVEIPVFVDIEKALNDAASRVPMASKPLEQKMADLGMKMGESLSSGMKTLDVEVDRISQRVSNAIMKMQKVAGQGIGTGGVEAMDEKMAKYANTVRLAAQQMLKLGESIGKVKVDGVNIQGVSQKLSVLANEWKSMKLGSKFDDDGKLRVRAQQIIDKMSKLVAQATKFGNALAYGSREAAAAEQEHINALMMTGETLGQLNTRLEAWRKELLTAEQGSTAFKTISREIQQLLERIQNLNNATKIYGSEISSINKVSAAMQSLNQKYAALSEADRRGAAGKKIIEQYKQLANYMDKEVKDLNQMYQLEQRLTNASLERKRTRQYENAVLNSTANTMHRLEEQARILSNRLNNAKFGTKQFEDLEKRLNAVNAKIAQMRGTVETTTVALSKQGVVLRNLTSIASMYFSVFGLLRFAKQLRDVTGELEYQRTALGRLIQDEEYGAKLFEDIKKLAQQSPFRITQLVTYTKQLAAYRIEQENLYDTTKRLADISAGLGVDMNRLILAYGQVRAASVLRGQELRQFTEAGIPLVELLAEKMGELHDTSYSTADVFKMISERAIPFSAIAEIFEDMTDKGGMFYKMQEKQAETIKGRWEKLKDAFDIGLQAAGETKTFQWQNKLALSILTFLAKNIRIVPKLIESLGAAWATYNIIIGITNLRHKLVAASTMQVLSAQQLLSAGVSKSTIRLLGYKTTTTLVTKANAILAGSNTLLSRSFAKLTLALLSNPYTAIAAAAIGIASAFLFWKKRTDETNDSMNDLNATIERLSEQTKKHDKLDKLIDSYFKLSNSAERSDAETRKLTKTINALQVEFPDLTLKIDADTESVKKNTEEMKRNNDERLRRGKDAARASLQLAQDDLSRMESERASILENYLSYSKIFGPLSDAKRQQEPAGEWTKSEERYYQSTKKELEKWEKLLNDSDQKIQTTENKIERLEKYLGEGNNTVSKAWKDQLRQMQLASNGAQIFTNDQLDEWNRLYDVSKDLEKEWKKLKEDLDALNSSENRIDPKFADEWAADISNLESKIQGLELIREFFGFIWGKQSSGGSSSYKQDPFIDRMNERMKFMQDFKKGYDDLAKYMTDESAQDAVFSKMKDRGLSLGLDAADQKRAAKDLSQWYADARAMAFEQAKKHGARGTIEDFLRQDIKDTSNKGKALKDFQKLIQSLWDAQTDLDTSNLKQEMEDALKKLEEDLKRSETVRNFYHDIFELTGDDQLATDMAISVYGSPGKEFAERIKDSIQGALDALDIDEKNSIGSELMAAFDNLDFRTLMDNLDKLPEKLRKPVQDAAQATEKYNADIVNSYAKLLNKFDEIQQQRVNIENQADKEIKTLREGLALELKGIEENNEIDDKEAAKKAAEARVNAVIGGIERDKKFQLSKLERDYRLFFSSVGVISKKTAQRVAEDQKRMLTEQFVKGEISLSKYKHEVGEVNKQLEKYLKNNSVAWAYLTGGTDSAVEKVKEYADSLISLASVISVGDGGIWTPGEDEKRFLDEIDRTLNFGAFSNIFKKDKLVKFEVQINMAAQKAYNQAISEGKSSAEALAIASEAAGEMAANTGNEMSAAASKFANGLAQFETVFHSVDALISFMEEDAERMRKSGGYVEDWGYSLFNLNHGLTEAYENLKSGNVLAGIISLGKGFQQMAHPIQPLNNAIEDQGKLIEDLEYSYTRLENAMEKSFGSEYIYNYNKQLEILEAKAAAYTEQARLEREKGKMADEDVARGYEKSARDIKDQIDDMQAQLSEFFSGTDLTSAAEDFADAWVEAYKEFGSTADAMSEKFNDMIESMISRSLAARIMQEMLQPIFDQIDTMSRDGLLSTEEIASVAALAQERIPMINDAMTNLMTSLASAGLDVRTSTAGLKGISKNIAGASEESVLGLAAAVNTQNFYMSFMPTINENVATILSVMTGGAGARRSAAAPGAENVEVMPSIQQMVYDHLPVMDQNLAEMLRLFKSVLTAKNSSTNTNYIAVK